MDVQFYIRTIVAVVSAAFTLWACGGDGDGCPEGTILQAGTCVQVKDNTPHEIHIDKDAAETGGEDSIDGVEVDPEDAETTDGFSGEGAVDASAPDAFPGGVIGRGCNQDMDCKLFGIDGECLDWPKGYCTILHCDGDGGPCPEGALCLSITPNAKACAATCGTSSECRIADGYGCKGIPDKDGEPVHVCYQVKNEGGPAEGCDGHQDCAGEAACLPTFAGGYCARMYCGENDPCDPGTACVLVNGVPACLKECVGDGDCVVTGDLPRTCAKMWSALVVGDKLNVCASGNLGIQIGGQCLNDTECDSEDCEVVYTGKCSFSKEGCTLDVDCLDGGICQQSADNSFGYCTQECFLGKSCPGESFCVGTDIAPSSKVTGKCLPACLEPGDVKCRPEAGLSCLFGDPVGSSAHYTCAKVKPGTAGSSCKTDSDCESGQCLVGATGGGYCTSPCGFQSFCPFPTSCQQMGGGGQYRCMLRCLSEKDCPPGLQCYTPVGAVTDICYP